MTGLTYLPPKEAAKQLGLSEDAIRNLAKEGHISSITVGKAGKHLRIPVAIAKAELEEYAYRQAASRRNGIVTVVAQPSGKSNLVAFDDLARRLLDTSRPGKKTRKQREREAAQEGVI